MPRHAVYPVCFVALVLVWDSLWSACVRSMGTPSVNDGLYPVALTLAGVLALLISRLLQRVPVMRGIAAGMAAYSLMGLLLGNGWTDLWLVVGGMYGAFVGVAAEITEWIALEALR